MEVKIEDYENCSTMCCIKVKQFVLAVPAPLQKPACNMGSHRVSCHLVEVASPAVTLAVTGRYSIYPPIKDERLSVTVAHTCGQFSNLCVGLTLGFAFVMVFSPSFNCDFLTTSQEIGWEEHL